SFKSVAQNYALDGPGSIAFNPKNPSLVNASIQDFQGGFLYSKDGGSTWGVSDSTYVYPGNYAYHPTLSNIVFTRGSEYTGAAENNLLLEYSTDSGASWNSF